MQLVGVCVVCVCDDQTSRSGESFSMVVVCSGIGIGIVVCCSLCMQWCVGVCRVAGVSKEGE